MGGAQTKKGLISGSGTPPKIIIVSPGRLESVWIKMLVQGPAVGFFELGQDKDCPTLPVQQTAPSLHNSQAQRSISKEIQESAVHVCKGDVFS